jgi:RNA-directed DNA polymerase
MNGQPCASSHPKLEWHSIDWAKCQQTVRRLQARIVKATQEGRYGKVKALQWTLTHSFSAKALAVRRVTENQGKKTPGVDGATWSTPAAKSKAIVSLRRHGYKPSPLRRVYIPKSNGKMRPLGIPTMNDRAMQALHLLALEPVAETTADKNSYGFRPERSATDAIEGCFTALAKATSAQWILEGDIQTCFDTLCHEWMVSYVPTDKGILHKWLKAGFIDNQTIHPTEAGAPQGGPISPTLMNMTLDGLERLLTQTFKRRRGNGIYANPKVHILRYADDFIVTGSSKELLENKVKPLITNFLKVRGLELSQEKTKITHISEGFDFLGQNIRKYDGKLLIKPSKKNIKAFLGKVRRIVKSQKPAKQEQVIKRLNPVIRGWANYHRHVVAKQTFSSVDNKIWQVLWRWAKRRHPNKGARWIKDKYFISEGSRKWVFAADTGETLPNGQPERCRLFKASDVPIRRHIKVKADANPFDPQWETYFERHLSLKVKNSLAGQQKLLSLWLRQDGTCPSCSEKLTEERGWHVHHIIPWVISKDDRLSNLQMVHPNCHRQIHSRGFNVVKLAPV